MKTTAFELALRRWPYGLELQTSRHGLVLRPRHKTRANWARAFRRLRPSSDDLASMRSLTNDFDHKEWEW